MADRPSTEQTRAQDAAGQARQAAGQAMQHGKEAAGNLAGRTQEAAGNVANAARQVAGDLGRAAQHGAEAAGHAAYAATSRFGDSLASAGQAVRERGPQSGYVGQATRGIAGGLEQGGQYLREEGLTGAFEDMTNIIRRNPLPALVIGFGIGFLLGNLTSSSRRS
jgi:hypothetical protein